jgi:hypothetical protein
MPNKLLFADEAGCFTFKKQQGASRYFILCTVAMDDDAVATSLIALRRELAWKDAELGEYFHACADRQAVRDAVFETILKHQFTVQATIMEKSKAQPQVRRSRPRFYQTGWYYHFKWGMQDQFKAEHEALITSACLGSKKERIAFQNALRKGGRTGPLRHPGGPRMNDDDKPLTLREEIASLILIHNNGIGTRELVEAEEGTDHKMERRGLARCGRRNSRLSSDQRGHRRDD